MRQEYDLIALQARKKRTLLSAFIVIFLVPITIFLGITFGNDQKYLIISLLIVFYTMIPFFMVFEKRKPKAREIVTVALMSAITAFSNLISTFMTPFQPATAIVIISGIALGPEAGFVVGALARLICNFFIGHGPWTPWQMFCWGILGFLSGLIFNKVDITKLKSRSFQIVNGVVSCIFASVGVALIGHFLKHREYTAFIITSALLFLILIAMLIFSIKGKDLFGFSGFIICFIGAGAVTAFLYFNEPMDTFLGWKLYAFGAWGLITGLLFQRKRLAVDDITLTVFGFLTTFIIYGGIMNISAMVMASAVPASGLSMSVKSLSILYISGVPYDFIHALGTAFFMFVFGEKFIQKIERVKIKYGFYL